MTKLTDNQQAILAQAAGHDGDYATLPGTLSKTAALKVGVSLVLRKLMREVRTKALTGMRKRGFAIERLKEAGQRSTYRILVPPEGMSAKQRVKRTKAVREDCVVVHAVCAN